MISHINSLIQGAFIVVIASGCFTGIIYLQFNRLSNQDIQKSKSYYIQQENREETQINTLTQAPTFGFDNLVADWAYYRFLQYFGDKPARRETGYSLLPEYLEAIAKKDPRFIEAYRYIAPVSSIYAGRPKETVRWLEKALEKLSPETPSSYLVWVNKAYDELLFLGNADEASQSYKMAAQWAKASDNLVAQRNAKGLYQTARFLEQNPNSIIPRIASWGMVLKQSQDQEIKEIAIEKIENLGGKVNIDSQGKVQIQFPQSNNKNDT